MRIAAAITTKPRLLVLPLIRNLSLLSLQAASTSLPACHHHHSHEQYQQDGGGWIQFRVALKSARDNARRFCGFQFPLPDADGLEVGLDTAAQT